MVNAIFRRLSPSLDTVTRGWLALLAGDVIRMGLGFGVSVLITRALGPANFGVYAVLGAAAGLVGVTADFGLSEAGVQHVAPFWQEPGQQDLAHRRGTAFFWVRLALAALVTGLALLLARPLARLLGLPPDVTTFWLLILTLLGVLASALSGAVSTLLTATGHLGRVALLLVANTGLTLLLAGALALSGRLTLVTALLLLGIIPALAAFAAGWRLLPGRWSLRRPPLANLRHQARQLLRFGRWLWLANLLDMLALQLDLLLLNHLGTAVTVGVYGLALNLATKLDVVNRSLYTALLPAAVALRGREAYRRYLQRGALRAGLILLLLLVVLPLSAPFIRLAYGVAYAPAVPLFRLLLVGVALDVVVLPLQLLAFPLNRPRWLAALAAVRVLALALSAIPLIPLFGAAGAVGARIVARLAGLLFLLLLLLRQWSPRR